MPVEIGKTFVRIRVRSPWIFKSGTFRTQDIGRRGHSLRIAAIKKKTGKWATQSYLILKKDIKKGDQKTLRLINQIKSRHGITVNLKRIV